jgi:hypothetical protein
MSVGGMAKIDGQKTPPLRSMRRRAPPQQVAINACGWRNISCPLAPDRLAFGVVVLHQVIAVAKGRRRICPLHAAPNAAMGLGGEILEEQGIHGALEADVKLGDLALAQRDDLNAREAEVLE